MSALGFTPPGGWEIPIILLIFILLFGAKKLPELGSSVGKSIRNFKKGLEEVQSETDEDAEATSSPASRDTD